MGKEFDLTGDPTKGNKFGFSPALLMQAQKYIPTSVIKAVSKWTGGEPQLTQAIFQLLLKHYVDVEYTATNLIMGQKEVEWFENFLKSVVIPKWKTISELTTLRDIEICLLNNPNVEPFWLLKEYQEILQQKTVPKTQSKEQKELLSLELIVLEKGNLRIHNSIYEAVFNNDWVEEELKKLSPYQLTLYQLESKSDAARKVLEEISFWTNGHLFLTKTICDFVCKSPGFIKREEITVKVKNIVQRHLIKNWERSLAAEYLKPIRDRLLTPDNQNEFQLLKLYRKILLGEVFTAEGSREERELIELGLLQVKAGKLIVFNPIYREIFNLDWVERELVKNTIESSNFNSARNRNKKSIYRGKKILVTGIILTAAIAIGYIAYEKIKTNNPELLPQSNQQYNE